MTTSPSNPVNRPMRTSLAHHLEDQLARVRLLRRNTERVLDHFGRLLDAIFPGVVKPAQHRTRIHLVADLRFENHTHGWVDLVFLLVASRAHHAGSRADVL